MYLFLFSERQVDMSALFLNTFPFVVWKHYYYYYYYYYYYNDAVILRAWLHADNYVISYSVLRFRCSE
jgi:hypothetical protein